MLSERSNASVPLSVMFPEIDPAVPPAPICSVPPLIVVEPGVLVPVSATVPEYSLTNPPLPVIAPANVQL